MLGKHRGVSERVGSEYILTWWDRMQSWGALEDSSPWPRSKSPYHLCWLLGVSDDLDDGGGRAGEAVALHVPGRDAQRVLRHFQLRVGRKRPYEYNQRQTNQPKEV